MNLTPTEREEYLRREWLLTRAIEEPSDDYPAEVEDMTNDELWEMLDYTEAALGRTHSNELLVPSAPVRQLWRLFDTLDRGIEYEEVDRYIRGEIRKILQSLGWRPTKAATEF